MAKWSPEICAQPAAKDVCDVTYDETSMTVGKKCSVHIPYTSLALVDRLRDEARRINYSRAEIETAFPDRFETGLGLNPDKQRAEMTFYFDPVRVLHLVLVGLEPAGKLTLQTEINRRFGAGLVVMD